MAASGVFSRCRDSRAWLCTKLDTAYYKMAKAVRLGYHLLDTGISMANVSMAVGALGLEGEWDMEVEEKVTDDLGLPDNIVPVASIPFPPD